MIVDVVRRFNLTYTQRIGVLDDSFLGTGRPLAASRLLFEVGNDEGASVRVLRDRLDLDSGHLSRLLRRLEAEGLVATAPDEDDRRRRVVRLTPAGRTAYDDLERRSEDRAASLVAPLTARQQERLAEALATADLLVRAATVRLREVASDDPVARVATQRYFDELDARLPGGFDTGGPDAPEPGATYVVAMSDGEPVAYGGIRPVLDDETAEIKRMWVHDDWRGAGLGARMLRHLEALAVDQGYRRAVLDTNGTLVEAIAMYERSGYRRIERYNDNPYAEAFFEKEL
ncbi:GNAT family N-acetyltransferase [Pimelobacter simplex]|uniref:Transcriptional regulator, MarR family n=1 Tax=Nocardioides simplex TaxID=2045 RepID=A0A0A1DHJ3_NOCSI|nr:bifunctional helix-turn-helix transcriptional regulator/GNAT family N-acetyltransferase [Pimelobacter simplex]AIY16779.1 Transcriptional regulator, MarR family [Pimelobacter simplex]MCG8151844.1 GNAT family N-acetyltransferase [Pimelobacter simplex]GEB12601.1 PadR family transcriptional regulator [Pimelobacter simplex]SFM57070.1 transcriptional regulator, MarR family with acetyltransferase activity [Pimelobacter simplex]